MVQGFRYGKNKKMDILMKAYLLLHRYRINNDKRSKYDQFWASVRVDKEADYEWFCYDTKIYYTAQEAKKDALEFCEWKGLEPGRWDKQEL